MSSQEGYAGFDGRSAEIKQRLRLHKKRREEEQATNHQRETYEQIEAVLLTLENAGNDISNVLIQTVNLNADAKKWFVEHGYRFTAEYAPDEDHYHSLWKIGLAE